MPRRLPRWCSPGPLPGGTSGAYPPTADRDRRLVTRGLSHRNHGWVPSQAAHQGAWAEIFGDPVAVAAMVDRLVHHADVIVLKGDSYRLRGKGEEVLTRSKQR